MVILNWIRIQNFEETLTSSGLYSMAVYATETWINWCITAACVATAGAAPYLSWEQSRPECVTQLSSDANHQSLQFRGGFAVSTLAVGSCDSLSQPQRCAQFVHSIWSQGTCFHQLKDSIQGHKPCQYSFEQVYLIGKTTLGKSQIYPKEIGQVLLTT